MTFVKSIGSKKVNFDFNKEFINIFSEKIKLSDIKFVNQTLKDLHPSDVADLIENLSWLYFLNLSGSPGDKSSRTPVWRTNGYR